MKKLLLILTLLLLVPISVWAYSDKIIVGGETIGIEVHAQGIYVVGFYPVAGKEIAKKAGFQIGDRIVSVNQKNITSIDELNQMLLSEGQYTFTVLREGKKKKISLPIVEEDQILKTGLYVKDQIHGIGTLSYIDPNTKIYGSLGHEIIENSSLSKFALKEGTIYKAEVSSIEKSRNGLTGSKNGRFLKNEVYGDIQLNETEGIFGKYHLDEDYALMTVGKKEEIHTGKAYIRTVIENDQLEDFMIDILTLTEDSSNKNILFEVLDNRLLQKTGGIVQGMSGSPILQDDKIIGVVNYVIVDDVRKGYGIFITTMLEKGDEILS